MSWTQQSFAAAIRQVVHKATSDTAFRAQVLADVHAAVKEVSGREVPEDFKINVVDGTGYQLTVVLPALHPSGELSDQELDDVAGGIVIGGIDYGPGSATDPGFAWPHTPENERMLNGSDGGKIVPMPKIPI